MAISKITTTPTPLSVVDKINEVIDGKLDTTATAAKATADASGNNIANTYATKATAITGLSVSGKVITYTKGNGSTGTITTQDTNTTYSAATTSAAGLMSAADKTKLDGVATGANKYSLPTASSSTLGGIKVGSGLSIASGVLSATGGGITASSLGTNGYVKFSNGLILQWGQRGATNATSEHTGTVWYPIAFSSCLNVEATQINPYGSDSNDIWVQIASISTASFTYWAQASDGSCYDGGCYWFAIGIGQQWGRISGSGETTVELPISMTTSNYYVTSSSMNFLDASSSGYANTFELMCYSLTINSFKIVIDTNTYRNTRGWFVIGWQQWGYISSVTASTATAVSLSVSASVIHIVASYGDHSETGYVCTAYVSSNTGYVKTIGRNNKPIYWFAITKQQWGQSYGKTEVTVSFPIAFSSACYAVVLGANSGLIWLGKQLSDKTYYPPTTAHFKYVDTEYGTTGTNWMAVGMQQWVICHCTQGDTWYSVNLPISYTNFYHYVGGEVTNIGLNGAATTATMNKATSTLSTIVLGLSNCDTNWSMTAFMLGIQQWGYITQLSTGPFYFPISFSAIIPAVLTSVGRKEDALDDQGYGRDAHKITKSEFYLYLPPDNGFYVFWIAIGCQQWGVCNNSETVSFPLTFQSTLLSFASNVKSYTATEPIGADITALKDVTKAGFTMGYIDYQWNGIVHYWIALGV